VIGIVAGPGADLAGIGKLRKAIEAAGAIVRVMAPIGGSLRNGARSELIECTFLTTRSIEYDAVVVAGGSGGLADVRLTLLLQETFRHCKVLGAWGDGAQALQTAGINLEAPGIVVADSMTAAVATQLTKAVGMHRVWEQADLVGPAA
jgi:catalase